MGRLIRQRLRVCLLLAEPEQVLDPGLCILIFVPVWGIAVPNERFP